MYDISIYFVVLEKGKLQSEFLKKNKHKLYNYVAGKLANKLVISNFDLIVRIDKSKGKQILREDFDRYFIKKLRENSTIKKVDVYHSFSHSWPGLQLADILAWSCFQKFEHNNNDYLNLLESPKVKIYSIFRK